MSENLPAILRRDILPGHGGLHVETRYQAPNLTRDERREYDLWVASEVFALLNRAYPGHRWLVEADSKKGVTVSIPVLMGGNWVYFIRWPDLDPARVIAAGGEILERYRLRRGSFELGSFLEARAKHSVLLGRSKVVPT